MVPVGCEKTALLAGIVDATSAASVTMMIAQIEAPVIHHRATATPANEAATSRDMARHAHGQASWHQLESHTNKDSTNT